MDRLTRLSLAHPWKTTLALLAVTVVLAAGLPRIQTAFGYRVLVGDDHPAIQRLDRFIEEFGGGLPVRIVYECGAELPCRHALDEAALRMAEDLTQQLRPLDGIRDVVSPASAPLVVGSDDGFAIRRLIEDGRIAPDHEELVRRARSDPLWKGALVSDDGSVGVVVVQPSDTRPETEEHVIDAVLSAVEPYRAEGFRFYPVGDAVSTVVSGRELSESSGRMVPLTVAVITLVLLFLTRSLAGSLASLATMGTALLWTYGVLGWMRWPQDGILEILAPLVLTVGVCDAVHLLARASDEASRLRVQRRGAPWREAIERAAADVGPACLVTSLTTGGAFLTFALSDLSTFVRFGSIATVGVFACLVLTFTLLPVLLATGPSVLARSVAGPYAWRRALESIVHVARVRSRLVLTVTLVVGIAFAYGWAAKLRVDNDWLESFGERSLSVRWIRFVQERLGPVDTLEVKVELPPDLELTDPEVLGALDAISRDLEQVPGLARARSLTDVLATVNRALRGIPEGSKELPTDPRANAELLELLYFGDQSLLDAWVSTDQRFARVSVDAPVTSSNRRTQLLDDAHRRIERHLPPGTTFELTGAAALNHDWVLDVQATQLRSFPAAFVLVFALVATFLRSVRLGLAAMLPTVLPVVVTLGAMAWMGMSLDVGRAMIAAVILGIAVDDSIHLLTQYRRERGAGHPPAVAIERAVLHVGRAVITTSLALALGFLTLMASAWQTVSSFGFYVALAILGALVADLLVLPACIYVFAARAREDSRVPARPLAARAATGRRLLLAVLVAPVVGVLGLAATDAVRGGERYELPCWVLPNARVALLPAFGDRCPLPALSEIRALRVGGERIVPIVDRAELVAALPAAGEQVEISVGGGLEERWIPVGVTRSAPSERLRRVATAAAVAGALLALPSFLLWFSAAPALVPFAFLYAMLATIAVLGIAARESLWGGRVGLAASVFGPAVLAHLALVFPRRRQAVREVPGLVLVPYGIAALLLLPAWVALERQPLLWPPMSYVLLFLAAAAWGVLLLSCGYAVRESESALARARARVVLLGALGLPVLMAPFVFISPHVAAGAAAALVASVALMPLPIGLAISRYNLFDLDDHLRRAVSQLVYFGLASMIVAGTVAIVLDRFGTAGWAPRAVGLVLTCGLVLAALEPLRARVLGWMEGHLRPRLEAMRAARSRFAREVAALREPEEVSKLLAEALASGLGSESGAVLRQEGGGWTVDHSWGRAPGVIDALAPTAMAFLGDRPVAQITEPEEDDPDPTAQSLQDADIEAVAAIRYADQTLGLALIGASPRREPYNTLELEFVEAISGQAALAYWNARTALELLEMERRAASGRIAVALVHEVGKEVGLLGSLARSLGSRLGDPSRAMRDLGMIEEIARDLDERLRGFVQEVGRARSAGVERGEELSEAVECAVRAVERTHGEGRTVYMIAPDLRREPVPTATRRILAILLDNAFRASACERQVRVSAVGDADRLKLVVSDRGVGMDPEQLERAFARGYSTRHHEGGAGLGLAIACDLAKAAGGEIELSRNPVGGIDAILRLPRESMGD